MHTCPSEDQQLAHDHEPKIARQISNNRLLVERKKLSQTIAILLHYNIITSLQQRVGVLRK